VTATSQFAAQMSSVRERSALRNASLGRGGRHFCVNSVADNALISNLVLDRAPLLGRWLFVNPVAIDGSLFDNPVTIDRTA
jgi:hypothetical protein